MDEKDFTGEGLDPDQKFWLFQADVGQDVIDARKKLGETQGWTDENWHENPDNLRTLFNDLNTKDAALLDRLGQASDDSTKLATLTEVVTAATPVEAPEQTAAEAPAAPEATAAAEPPPAPAAPEAAPPVAKKVSIFAKKPDREVAPDSSSGPGAKVASGEQPASEPTAVPDTGAAEGAVGDQAPAAPPAKKSLFARKPAATGEAAAPPAGEAAAPETAPASPSVEDLHAEVLGFGADPDSPLSEEEAKAMVADPEFAKKLADAEKEIEEQLAALESEGSEIEGVSA